MLHARSHSSYNGAISPQVPVIRVPAERRLTIPLHHATPLFQELRNRGYSIRTLCRELGVVLPPGWTEHTETVLPAPDFARLHGHACRLLEAETSERSDRSRISKEAVELMYYCAINCNDLREVIGRVAAYCRVAGPVGAVIEIEEQGCEARLRLELHRRTLDRAALIVCLTTVRLFQQFFSWLIAEPIALTGLSVKYPAPNSPLLETHALDVTPGYDQDVDELRFSREYLDRPVLRSHAELGKIIDYLGFEIGYAGAGNDALAGRVRQLIAAALEQRMSMPRFDTVARLLHIGPATLRRRLEQEGCSFTRLQVECQRQRAEYLLRCSELATHDIALYCGFSDDRAFRRAFRSWSGRSPSEFRAEVLAGHAARPGDRHHAVKLPGDGADADVPDRDHLRQHLRAKALGA